MVLPTDYSMSKSGEIQTKAKLTNSVSSGSLLSVATVYSF